MSCCFVGGRGFALFLTAVQSIRAQSSLLRTALSLIVFQHLHILECSCSSCFLAVGHSRRGTPSVSKQKEWSCVASNSPPTRRNCSISLSISIICPPPLAAGAISRNVFDRQVPERYSCGTNTDCRSRPNMGQREHAPRTLPIPRRSWPGCGRRWR